MKFFKIWLFVTILLTASTMVSAEIFNFNTPTDNLELNEELGDVVSVIDSLDLSLLSGNTIITDEGTSKSEQYLRFGDATLTLSSPVPKYIESDDDKVTSFLYIASGSSTTTAFFEHELAFNPGLEGRISGTRIPDIEDRTFRIFADDYKVVDTYIDKSSSKIKLTLSTSAITDILREGDLAVYQIGSNKYEILVNSISSTPKSVMLRVNGQDVGPISEDSYYELADDTLLGIRTIITSSGGVSDIVSIFLGAKIIELEDHYNDDSFEEGFSENRNSFSEGMVSIKASVSSEVISLTSIRYRATTNNDIYIPKGKKLSEVIDDKNILLGNWDLKYEGLKSVPETDIILSSSSDTEYDLTFENTDGRIYKVPFYEASGKLGDSSHDLFISESTGISDYEIGISDYLLLSSGSSKNDKSYVLQYISTDTASSQIKFNEVLISGTNPVLGNYNGSGYGAVTVQGMQFDFYVDLVNNNKLAFDLNRDGNIESTDSVDIITKGGAIIDLGTTKSPGNTYTISLTTESSSLEESTTDEVVTLDITGGSMVGISTSSFTNLNIYSSEGVHSGMSNYGVEFIVANANNADPEELEINYPLTQRFADLKLELLKSTADSASKTSSTSVPTNTCSDGIQNGDETGIDCGGSCNDCTQTQNDSTSQDQQAEQEYQDQQSEQSIEESPCSFGCVYIDGEGEDICIKIGEAIDNLFCKAANNLIQQKTNGASCNVSLECISESCDQQKCGKTYGPISTAINIILILLILFSFFKISSKLKQ
ncbi:hypothetical protein HOE22_10565 [Candidatus Woesearchaeota archaeon]|nr:hypothetical protein [Candidatus Woesearchaeota archaeon]